MEYSNNDEKNSSYEPIVFVNNPITQKNEDVIGFDSQIKTLNKAIEQGAKIIGVIADYGTGKSSLTELLVNNINDDQKQKCSSCRKKTCKPIYVNLWDSLNKNNNGNDKEEHISVLTRSFLYQLSRGYDIRFGKHINRLLSKNYENISFSINASKKNYFMIIVACTLFTLYLISGISGTGIMKHFSTNIDMIGSIFKIIGPIFLFLTAFFLYCGLKDKSIVFSHWKMPNRREPEINDIYDIYNIIVEKLAPKDGCKRYIFINDLDRIDNPALCIDFLKELYRFQECLGENKDKFVFIISVKPKLNHISDRLFSKIFDYTLYLKPIHFDDYDSLLLKLFESNPKQKKELEKLLGYTIGEHIPDDFKWIKRGGNLTLRDIKQRLNQSISIMLVLKNKDYKIKTSTKFQSCAAVVFLEDCYPADYYKLISYENDFANFVRESRSIIDSKKKEGKLESLKKLFNEKITTNKLGVTFSKEFIDELCGMLLDGLFNDDYRMYFYTYPKGSHIKTTDERDLCDALLFPNTYLPQENLDTIIERVFSNGENEIIRDVIESLEAYPNIVIEHDKLFALASKINTLKVFEVFSKEVFVSEYDDTYKANLWSRLLVLDKKTYQRFIKLVVNRFNIATKAEEDFLNVRKPLVVGLKSHMLDFEDLFKTMRIKHAPQITEQEINYIDNLDISLKLVDLNNLRAKHVEYILEHIISQELKSNKEIFDIALKIVYKIMEVADVKTIANSLLDFLIINNHVDEKIFNEITGIIIDKNKILKYLKSLNPNNLSVQYLQNINNMGINQGLPQNYIKILMRNDMFLSPLVNMATSADFNSLKEFQKNKFNYILDACTIINQMRPDLIASIRKYLRFDCGNKDYNILFFHPFDIIKDNETIYVNNNEELISLIDVSQVTEENYNEVFDFLYDREYTSSEIMFLFSWFFDNQVNQNCISNNELKMGILEDVDYQKLNLRILNEDQRNSLYDILSDGWYIQNAERAIEVSYRIGCLIPQIEEIITQNFDKAVIYCELISEQNEFTSYTIKWLNENYLTCALSKELCDKLYQEKDYINYIIGSVLRENNMIIDYNIPFDCYIAIYRNVEEMFDIMSDHWEFLEILQEKVDFDYLTDEHIKPIFKTKQKQRFFEYIFSDKSSESLKEEYICSFGELASSKDSEAFQQLICQPQNIEKLDSYEKYKYIHQRLWTRDEHYNRLYHQKKFTIAWKKHWKNEQNSDELAMV